VAFADSVTWVELSTDWTTVFAGIPVPLTGIPGDIGVLPPFVVSLSPVTTAEPLVTTPACWMVIALNSAASVTRFLFDPVAPIPAAWQHQNGRLLDVAGLKTKGGGAEKVVLCRRVGCCQQRATGGRRIRDRGGRMGVRDRRFSTIERLQRRLHVARQRARRRHRDHADPERLSRQPAHNAEWVQRFQKIVTGFPEVVGFYRLSGDVDYLIRAVVSDIRAYDDLYQRLIAKIDLHDVSSMFTMEQIKSTTELPILSY
jgi:DNA-binding Lrp family transcriptional regulator